MVTDDTMDNSESQTRSFCLGGKIGVEDIGNLFFGDSFPRVSDDDDDRLVLGVIVGDDGDNAPIGHRLL